MKDGVQINHIEAEHELLTLAMNAFQEEAGLDLELVQRDFHKDGYMVDAVVRLQKAHELGVETKKWAQQVNLGAMVEQIRRLPMKGMLVADYVNTKMAQKLRAENVMFIDTAGNAYIDLPPIHVWVTGNKKATGLQVGKETASRAFEPTGLKVIYAFLCNPELVNATYREIAENAGVALGTVGWVLNGLKEAGFIIDRGGKRARRLVNRRRLLDRWVETYPERLKPKQRVGEFVTDNPYWWQGINLQEYGAYWGGEIAAAKYTNYLKPQVAMLYLPEGVGNRLLADAKLRKAVDWTADGPGIVRIYRPFWPEQITENNRRVDIPNVVDPTLVYADLIATGDSRNLETARMIYDQFIVERIGED